MKKVYLIFLFLFLNYSQINADEQSIILKYKVNDDLITNYDIIKKVNTGEEFELLEEATNWSKIKLSESQEGWAYNSYIENK